MMRNGSQVEVLVLSGFQELQQLWFLYVLLTFSGFLLILLLNVSVLAVICVKRSLHRPMYIFLGNLLLNTLIGCTAFYPKLLQDLLREVQLISRTGCLLQAFSVHLYVSVECNLLMVMAFDRYAAVAHPLSYHHLLSSSSVWKLLAASWLLPLVLNAVLIFLSGRLPLCRSRVGRVFCDNRSVTGLACVDVSLVGRLELVLAAGVVFLPLVVIFCCYLKILVISFQLSASRRPNKALSTCVPHLLTYISLVISIVFEVVQPVLSSSRVPQVLRVLLSMEGFLLPPLLNPLVYGLKMAPIRSSFTPRIS